MHTIKDIVKQLIGKSLDAYNTNYTKVVNTRIDNIVAQAGNDNTEIVDARIDSAGVTHTTLNNRILAETKMNDEQLVEYTGSNISAEDTTQGYLKDVEILGNTIQNEEDLADIKSVGVLQEDGTYKMSILSCGKNLFNPLNKNIEYSLGGSQNKVTYKVEGDKIIIKSNPSVSSDWGWVEFKNIKVTPNKSYTIHPNATVIKGNVCVFVFDSNNTKLFEIPNTSKTFIPTTKHITIRLYVQTTTSYTDAEIHYKPQLEEGTQATPYEPYQENKCDILLPCQLEKVGDVSDRIIEKDGVWGVEKNVKTILINNASSLVLSGWNNSLVDTMRFDFGNNFLTTASKNLICDRFINIEVPSSAYDYEYISVNASGNLSFNVLKNKLTSIDLAGGKKYVVENPFSIKYATTQPQFIPLPHDQQVKLRTFANKTNISFGCEIEGTIKAQVPKSLGATVNTHTEQINNLNKELDRVKKLEESTVSTVTTESDFTTVEATSNGYFEDVKLEGKTLVNLAPKYSIKWTHSGTWLSTFLIGRNNASNQYSKVLQDLKPNTEYTIIVNIKTNTQSGNIDLNNYQSNTCVFKDNMHIKPSDIGVKTFKVKTVESFDHINPSDMVILRSQSWGIASGETLIEDIMILEGDHTQNPPSGYIEGLKSVGQDVDEIVVSSVKGDGNLFRIEDFKISSGDGVINQNSGTYTTMINKNNHARIKIKVKPNTEYIVNCDAQGRPFQWRFRDINQVMISPLVSPYDTNTIHTINTGNNEYIYVELFQRVTDSSYSITFSNIYIGKSSGYSQYTPHQSNKKRLLFYNEETQAWEKPILREWDSIEKHSDGKYYYHKRSEECVLDGSVGTFNVSVIENNDYIRWYRATNTIIPKAKVGGRIICDTLNNETYAKLETRTCEGIGIKNQTPTDLGVTVLKSRYSATTNTELNSQLASKPITFIYEINEEVYECTNIDLITYSGETNYIVESGVISPKSALKVHNNISNVVSLLQKKVSLLEGNITSYMITQNRMQLASTYSADSVTFKVDYTLCSEETEEYNEDLYNLILNNILVGKDNYDYDKMFTMILDYASWNQISWEQFDILVGLMDMQHNPPVEDEIVEEIPNEVM